MASVGHILVGMATARANGPKGARLIQLWRPMLWWSLVSLAPDVDYLGYVLGVPYGAPWGHRGATHSLGISLLAGALGALVAARWKLPPLRTALITFGVVLSHALLDTMTTGGLGCALCWPLSNERFFAPEVLQQIPVAPLGLGMVSLRGLLTITYELVLFCPLLIYLTFPRRASGAGAGGPAKPVS